jgi:hypothetical protein
MNEDELRKLLEAAMPKGLISNYVIVCETYDEFGADLHVMVSENTTPWLAMGMVDSAQDIIQMGNVTFAGCDDDEDFE